MIFKSLLNDLKTGNPLGKTAMDTGKEKLMTPLYSLPLGIGSTIANLRGKDQDQAGYIPSMDNDKKQLDASYKIIDKLDGLNRTMMGIQDTLKQQSTVYDELLDDAEKQQDSLGNKKPESTAETKVLDAEPVDKPKDGILKTIEDLGVALLGIEGIIGVVGGAGLLGSLAALVAPIAALAVGLGAVTIGAVAFGKWMEDHGFLKPEHGPEAMGPDPDAGTMAHNPAPYVPLSDDSSKPDDSSKSPSRTKPTSDAEPISPTEYVTGPDGNLVKKSGGSHSWRNNNPGNIKGGHFAKEHGATGEDTSGFAVFPSEETGDSARRDLLFGPNSKYRNLPVSDAIARYTSGDSPEEVKAYQTAILKAINNDDIPLKDLPENEKTAMLDAMKNHEGWKVGTEEVVNHASYAAPPGPSEDGSHIATDGAAPDFVPPGEFVPPKIDSGVKFHVDSKEKAATASAPIVIPVPMPSGGGSGGGGGSRTTVTSAPSVVSLGSSPPPNSVDINGGH